MATTFSRSHSSWARSARNWGSSGAARIARHLDVVGGIGFGILSDYYGRVRVLTWTILLFAIFSGLGALAQGYWDLVIYRTVAGLGLGGEFGIGMALVAETWPPNQRARGCSYAGLGWQAGVLLAALTTPLLLPHVGWRGMFLIELIPGLVAFAVRAYMWANRK
jgi:MFS family permease